MRFISDIEVRLIQHVGGDHMVVAAAKVSVSPEEALKLAQDEGPGAVKGLIGYLMKHRHGTPFEHGCMTFYVHAPIFVWREWHRHRVGHCLAGDSQIWLETVGPNSGRTVRKRAVADIYRHWKVGVEDEVYPRAGRGVTLHECGLWRAFGRREGRQVHLGYFKTEGEAQIERAEWVKDNSTTRTRLLPACKNLPARVLNEDTQLFEIGRMADVFDSGVKELFLLKTEPGHDLRASRDHRVLTQDGWAALGELRKGDRVAVVGKRSMFAERQIPPSLRNGIGVRTTMQRKRLIRDEDRCYVCGSQQPRELLTLDHVVPVVSDLLRALDTTNLKPVCVVCHRLKTNTEQSLARRGNVAGSKYVRLAETPKRVGEGATYDIEMSGPHHNLVANGVVVHNSYNEESGRYKQLDPVFYVPPRERAMMKADGWKPGRPKFLPCESEDTYRALCSNLKQSYELACANYEENLALGVDPGLARDCLPVGIYSSCWVTLNPRSLMHFLSLRTHEPEAKFVSYPLYEIEVAARKVEEEFRRLYPITYAAWVENGRVSP